MALALALSRIWLPGPQGRHQSTWRAGGQAGRGLTHMTQAEPSWRTIRCQTPATHSWAFPGDHAPLQSGFYLMPRRHCPLLRITPPSRDPHLGNWKDPPKKLMLSDYNSRSFGPSKIISIHLPGPRFSLPRSPPEQVIKAVKVVLSYFLAQRRWRGRSQESAQKG